MIQVEGVSKRFSRSLKHALWYGLCDVTKEISGRGQSADGLRPREFWALRDVSFDVGKGETVGLIGHNGAGKTTLLKLINGLIKPSQGRITVSGSVRALIALGTGFNPVLTGRENVRVASAVLGYGERETRERLEEIIEFSELGDFIDAPLQSYSSGMLARLGFAVAIHTRPDILLVDEVLAVGDLNFAIKCYRKIADFRNHGGSIVLVTHNPYSVRTNCDRVVWIEHGVVQQSGDAPTVCDAYELAVARQDAPAERQEYTDGTVRLVGVSHASEIESGDRFAVEFVLEATRQLVEPIVMVSFTTVGGQTVVSNVSAADDADLVLDRGVTTVKVEYEELPLAQGVYAINLVVAERSANNQVLAVLNFRKFEVRIPGQVYAAGMIKMRPRWQSAAEREQSVR
jgi:ABC-type polysaccharide/polyol phosphate transport system ATPase subunit